MVNKPGGSNANAVLPSIRDTVWKKRFLIFPTYIPTQYHIIIIDEKFFLQFYEHIKFGFLQCIY